MELTHRPNETRAAVTKWGSCGRRGFLWPIFQFPACNLHKKRKPESPLMGAAPPARNKTRAKSLDNENSHTESKCSGFHPKMAGKEQPFC